MPDDTNPTQIKVRPIQTAWLSFTKSVQILLVPQVDDRPLDQYLAFRNTVLELVQSEKFLAALNSAWSPFTDFPQEGSGDALIMELQAFPLAMEVAGATEKPEDAKKWWKKMLGRASTISGSVKDLLDALPPEAKMALTLFGELIDLFKGQDWACLDALYMRLANNNALQHSIYLAAQ
jgi:hypothetical protein